MKMKPCTWTAEARNAASHVRAEHSSAKHNMVSTARILRRRTAQELRLPGVQWQQIQEKRWGGSGLPAAGSRVTRHSFCFFKKFQRSEAPYLSVSVHL